MKSSKPNKTQRELAVEWGKIQTRWQTVTPFARTTVIGRLVTDKPDLQNVMVLSMGTRQSEAMGRIPSRVTEGGVATVKPAQKYTGTEIVGLATMHKSNIVPIFNTEAAKEVASMRR